MPERNVGRRGFAGSRAVSLFVTIAAVVAMAGNWSDASNAAVGEDTSRQHSASSTEATQQVAVMVQAVRKNAYQSRIMLRDHWLPVLMAKKHYRAVVMLARLDILKNPDSTNNVNILQTLRVRALLAMGKTHQALANAKSLFNVATMLNTASAIMLLAQCLKAASTNGPQQAKLLRQQEIAGAKAPAVDGKMVLKPVTSSLLANIHVNAAAYMAAWRKAPGTRMEDLVGHGNLLLLADKPAQARICFDQAYSMAWNNTWLAAISDRIAASIKAQDGTVGRANAWVLKIRPGAMTNDH